MSIPKYKICGLRWLLFGTGILILAALTLKCDPALYDRIEALEKNATTTDSREFNSGNYWNCRFYEINRLDK